MEKGFYKYVPLRFIGYMYLRNKGDTIILVEIYVNENALNLLQRVSIKELPSDHIQEYLSMFNLVPVSQNEFDYFYKKAMNHLNRAAGIYSDAKRVEELEKEIRDYKLGGDIPRI